MLLNEPNRTNYDWNFTFLGFAIRVSPYFLVLPVLLGMSLTRETELNAGVAFVMVIIVFFVSILVHELGHALAYRYFGQPARIVIYWMGGLAISEGGSDWVRQRFSGGLSSNQKIIVSLAGPAAGFLLALLLVGFIYGIGGKVHYHQVGILPVLSPNFNETAATEIGRFTGDGESSSFEMDSEMREKTAFVFVNGEQLNNGTYFFEGNQLIVESAPEAGASIVLRKNNPAMQLVFSIALWINIFINILNLAPVFPLDGGQVARELFTQSDRVNGLRYSYMTSIFVAGAIAIVSLLSGSQFMGIFFAIMAYSNYTAFQQMGGGYGGGYGGGRPW